MKSPKPIAGKLILAYCLFFLISCGSENKKAEQEGDKAAITKTDTSANADRAANTNSKTISPASTAPFTIETFSEFPPEIDGCACYFSADESGFKKREYIYANNYAEISFVKINGAVVKFNQTESKESGNGKTIQKAKSDQYELKIEIMDGGANGDETHLKTGTITITDKNGKSVTRNFYGECGC